MNTRNRYRPPQLLGPRWQELALAAESAPREASFHASLRACAENPVEQRPRLSRLPSPLPSRAAEHSASTAGPAPQAPFWPSVKSASPVNTQPQVAEAVPVEKSLAIRPKPTPQSATALSALVRGWSWLNAKYKISAPKRLRVAETISLGEKRFVALVSVEGREFLIGGGPAGVSLMTQLGAAPGHANDLQRELGLQEESQ